MRETIRMLIMGLLLAVLALTMMTGAAIGEEEDVDLMFVERPEEIELPALEEAQEDDIPLIDLLVDGYALTLKAMLPETITYAPAEDSRQMDVVFSVLLSAEEGQEERVAAPIFTMILEEDIGDHVIILNDEAGNTVPVAFYMEEMPEGLSEQHASEFIVAQLDVHVLTATLGLKSVPEKTQAAAGVSESTLAGGEGYELTYSVNEEAGLNVRSENGAFVFYIIVDDTDVTVFTVEPGSQEGDIVEMLAAPEGNRVPVAISMAECPKTLDKQQTAAFYTAQEAAMQVMASLTLR